MSGRTCHKWTEQSDISPSSGNGIGLHSYCRNPDQSMSSPWCFVFDAAGLKKERCLVDICEDEERDFKAEAEALDIYMGSNGCSSCGTGLLELGRSRGLRLGAPSNASTPTNTSALAARIAPSLAMWTQECRQHELVLLEGSAANGTSSAVTSAFGTAAAAARQLARRRCGLTEMVNKHCACSGGAAVAQSKVALDVAKSESNATSGFFEQCSNACFSSSCSSCTTCTATCQSGPFAYCKDKTPAGEKQMWWAMCGVTTHDMLMAGKKQCGDSAPTGCPN